GMCGVETIVPLMLNAVNEGKLSILKFAQLLSSNPAKNFDIFPKKGSLMVGTDADITIIDMDIDWTIKKKSCIVKVKLVLTINLMLKVNLFKQLCEVKQ